MAKPNSNLVRILLLLIAIVGAVAVFMLFERSRRAPEGFAAPKKEGFVAPKKENFAAPKKENFAAPAKPAAH